MSAIPLPKIVERIENPDETILTKGLIKDKIKIWGINMVKQAKDLATSSWVSPILLGLLLSYNIYNNQTSNARITAQDVQLIQQHDLLIELKTLKEVEEKSKIQERIDKKMEDDLDRVYREKITNTMNRLELIVQGKHPNNFNKEN